MLAMATNTLGILATTLLEGENLLATVVFDNFGLDEAPATNGAPILASAPTPTTRTSLNSMTEPASASSFSMVSTSLAATRYCLPPV